MKRHISAVDLFVKSDTQMDDMQKSSTETRNLQPFQRNFVQKNSDY